MNDTVREEVKTKKQYIKPEIKTFSEDDLKDIFPEVYAASMVFADMWGAIAM